MKRLLAVLLVAPATLAGCGGGPNGPSDTAPRVTNISPTSGPSSGGTTVTILGSNFSAGAFVTIGSTPATNVNVLSATTLTAVTGQRSAGAADVVVSVGGRSGSLPGGFTYVAGQAPQILSVVAKGSRANEPERFADLDEEISVTVTAQDPDTPAANLKYGWAAPAGTFTGTGASVKWKAPSPGAFTTPGTVTLTVSVSDGDSSATGTVVIRVHNSVKEVGDMARQFLVDFSEQKLAPEQIVRNFSDECSGKSAELSDVRDHQLDYRMERWRVDPPVVSVTFGGFCPFPEFGDACAEVRVDWLVTCIYSYRTNGSYACDVGHVYHSTGVDQVNAIYSRDRWSLCSSRFQADPTIDLTTGRVVPGLRIKK